MNPVPPTIGENASRSARNPSQPKPQPRRVRADSPTMKGGGTAGVATLGAAGVEVTRDILAETQSAVLPLVPYLDTFRWVVIHHSARGHRNDNLCSAR